jgi:hypothetical protein
MKNQSSVEFLITYGFALTIIGIGIAALYSYFLFKNPTSYVSGSCSISSLYCSTAIAIKGNSTVKSYILLYVTNSFSKTISFPQNSFNVTYYTTSFNGTCLPSNLVPGATAICIANVTLPSMNVGDTFRVNIRIPFIYANQRFNASGIADLVLSPTISQTSLTTPSYFSVAPPLIVESYYIEIANVWPGDGVTLLPLRASLKINNYPQRGMQITFSSNDSRVIILPNVSITNADGIATAFARTTTQLSTPINVKITATYSYFSTTSTSVTVKFLRKFEDFEQGSNGWTIDCCSGSTGNFVNGYASQSALRINSTNPTCGLACAIKPVNVVSGEIISFACKTSSKSYPYYPGCRLGVWNGTTYINLPDINTQVPAFNEYPPINGTWYLYFTQVTKTQNGVWFYIYNNGTTGKWSDYDNIYTSV